MTDTTGVFVSFAIQTNAPHHQHYSNTNIHHTHKHITHTHTYIHTSIYVHEHKNTERVPKAESITIILQIEREKFLNTKTIMLEERESTHKEIHKLFGDSLTYNGYYSRVVFLFMLMPKEIQTNSMALTEWPLLLSVVKKMK